MALPSCSGMSETKVALSRLIWLINLVLLVSGSIRVAHLRHQSKIRRGFKVSYFALKGQKTAILRDISRRPIMAKFARRDVFRHPKVVRFM